MKEHENKYESLITNNQTYIKNMLSNKLISISLISSNLNRLFIASVLCSLYITGIFKKLFE